MPTNNRIKTSKSAPKKPPQSPLSSAGIIEEENKEPEAKEDVLVLEVEPNNIEEHKEESKPDVKEEVKETPKPELKKDEIAVEHVNAEIVHKQEDILDLFNIKKKEKIQKGQKNLVLKLSNIEFLENLAHDTKRDQGEIIDTLLENLAKMMDMNK